MIVKVGMGIRVTRGKSRNVESKERGGGARRGCHSQSEVATKKSKSTQP